MKRNYGYWLLTCALVAVSCFGGYEFYRARRYEAAVQNNYNRAFFELNDYVDDINTLIAKGLAVNSPAHFAEISAELSRQSAAAKECIAQLPLSGVSLDNTEKFLSQVGDYSFYLSKNALYDTAITEEEYENLASLGRYAGNLSAALNSLCGELYAGAVSFSDPHALQTVAYAAGGSDGFSAVEKEFGEYPSLIYDGPFSEHIGSRAPAMCEGAPEITPEQAARIAGEFFGRRSGFISYKGESKNSAINCYTFTAGGGKSSVSITKQGGYVLYYMNAREVGEQTIDRQQAIELARKFLDAHGYSSMRESYYELQNGTATVNFAYEQDGVVCYSDLVKVEIALDDGEVVGLETNGYLMNHSVREGLTPAISRDNARAKVSRRIAIASARVALIPKDSEREVLCYEFKGSVGGKNVLVYINAQNGREEEILLLVESDEGILTV